MAVSKDGMGTVEWVVAKDDAWGAVPGNNLLDPACAAWAEWRITPPDRGEATSLALIGQCIKYRQSLGVALPLLNGEGITRLMMYLQRLRLDALQGGIRSPWLNPGNVEIHPDIVFIGRPRSGFQELSRVPALHARILRPGTRKSGKLRPAAETLVVDGAADLMELTDLIGKESRPFVLVIDGTRGGNDNAAAIDSALEECFPLTPRLILLSLGDGDAMARLRQSRSSTHLWVMRREDAVAVGSAAVPALQLSHLTDPIADAALNSIGQRFFSLRRLLAKSKDPVLKDRLAICGKVFRAYNELATPLSYLEETLQHATRPGMFPVRCLSRWMELAGKDCCQYGDMESASRTLLNELSTLHGLLKDSVPGKAAWLRDTLMASRQGKRSILVLLGGPHEVTALERWLDECLDPDWTQTIKIVAMDGVNAYRQHASEADEVILLGMLWPSRQHWLALPCRQITLPVYGYEKVAAERALRLWWRQNGTASVPNGDKHRLWRLDWVRHRCLDQETIDVEVPIAVVECRPRCSYPPRTNAVSVPLNAEMDNWLDLLLEEPAAPEHSYEEGENLSPDLVWITTRELPSALPWSQTRPVLVLSNDDLHPTRPEFLKEGDQIILLHHTEERIATQEMLFNMVVAEVEGMHQLLRAANRWQTMIDVVASRYRPHQLQPHLKKEGVNLTDQAIASWFRHKVFGPRDRAAVLVVARLAGVNEPEKAAKYISNGIEQVRGMHQHLGQQLTKAILERSRGATSITIGALALDGQAFDDMFQIVTVEGIRLPASQAVVAPRDEGLGTIAEQIMALYPGRLHFTVPALKSMRDSSYKDPDRFRTCLTLMATQLYDHYRSKTSRLHDVLEHFTQANIEFQPKMSGVTMGQYGDNRRYKTRNADMNRHFCLGNARDVTRTLRIHFEWDDEDQLLVIHHAGRHLETTQS